MIKRLYFLILFLLVLVVPVFAQPTHTRVQLISEQDTMVPGKTFWVGLDFVLEDGWHMYWQNPGDSGLAPKIKWTLPAGFKAGEIQWPYPKRLDTGSLTSYGYEHELLLLVPVTIDQNQASLKSNLHARVDWLACREICIPGRAELDLPVSIGPTAAFNNSKRIFDQDRVNIPRWVPEITSRFSLEGNQWHLKIQTPSPNSGDITFYPFRNDVIEHAAAENVDRLPDGYQVNLTKSHLLQGPISTLEGIAVNAKGWDEHETKAIIIQAPLGMISSAHVPFLLACLFALIGGLILNLMPCVLPVLSIKVLHLVERHPDKKIAFQHSLMYTLGVLVSVWALALLLFILKSAGSFAGWGFQFQSPVFVIIVAVILFVLALNLFGVFEFSVPTIGGLAQRSAGYQASFISGVITTIVASPCTAPFMGTALTVAISQPNIIGFGIFTSLGLGLALPFLVLSIFPSLLSFLPKPGPWMVNLKRFFGAVLIACVLWMLWVFGLETGIGNLSHSSQPSHTIEWQAFSPAEVMKARQSGHGVFLDFTAAWCINCQINDRLVLQNSSVVAAFKDKGITAFKADWTKYDPDITRALASYGRDSIPVYVYYPPGSDSPEILPQVITPNTILDHINK